MAAIWLLALAASCNVTLLAAIAAGRYKGGWRRSFSLAAEGSMFFVAIVLACGVGATREFPDPYGALAAGIAFALGLPLAGFLTYLEYWLVGRRHIFGTDLRNSTWLARGWTFRLVDPERAQRRQTLLDLKSGDPLRVASALDGLSGELGSIRERGGSTAEVASKAAEELKVARKRLAGEADGEGSV